MVVILVVGDVALLPLVPGRWCLAIFKRVGRGVVGGVTRRRRWTRVFVRLWEWLAGGATMMILPMLLMLCCEIRLCGLRRRCVRVDVSNDIWWVLCSEYIRSRIGCESRQRAH